MSQRWMLDYIADSIIDGVLQAPYKVLPVRQALERAYPFGDQPAGRLIWEDALVRHAHRIATVEAFLSDTLEIDLSAELERVWKQENARRLFHQATSTYRQ